MMKRIIAGALAGLLVFASPALAADNYAATQGSGTTFAAKNIAGVLYPWWIPANSSGTEIFTSGAAGYVQVPSGGIASGAVASGAYASGAFAAGSGTDGWNVTLGAKADAACGTPGGTCSLIALQKWLNTNGIITTGTAGSASTQVLTVQGIASMTPILDTPQANENHIGEVGGNIIPIAVALTTSNNTVTTGKSIGGTLTLANAVRVSGSLGASGTSGILQNLSLFFKDAVAGTSADIYIFNASPSSTCTDNTAFALSASDLAKVVGIVHVTDFTASNTGIIAQANNLAMSFGLSSATSLFACLVARGSFAITSTANVELIANILRQ